MIPHTACNGSEWQDKSPAHRRVVEFLTLDIQNSPEAARQLYEHIHAVETGQQPRYSRSGNAYYVSVSPQEVSIENLIIEDEPIETLSLQEFKQIVLALYGGTLAEFKDEG